MPDDTRSRPELDDAPQAQIPRRKVLEVATTAIAVAALPNIAGCASDFGEDAVDKPAPPDGELDTSALDTALTVDVLRKEDFVCLKLAFVNLQVNDAKVQRPPMAIVLKGQLWLGRIDPNAAAYIVASHQPQHFFEETFDEGGEVDKAPPIPGQPSFGNPTPSKNTPVVGAAVKHRMAEPSRLAFLVPANVTAIPYELEPILSALASYQLNVVSTATPQPAQQQSLLFAVPLFNILGIAATSAQKTKQAVRASRARQATASFVASNPDAMPRVISESDVVPGGVPTTAVQPSDLQTSIELPYRLKLSPNVYGRFEHAAAPLVSANNRVELWHTRLTAKESWQQTVRAVWTRDVGFDPNNAGAVLQGANTATPANAIPLYGPMFARDRADIVHLCVNQTLKDENELTRARAIPARKLMLSALGGYIDSKGAWAKPSNNSGGPSLLNWDNFSTLGRDHFVRIVRLGYLYPYGHEAVWIRITERKFRVPYADTAYPWTRQFVVVTQPLKTYENVPPKVARGFPFKSIRFKTLITPLLDPMATASVPNYSAWPYVGGKAFRFEVQGFDHDGNSHDFTTACIWMDFVDAYGSKQGDLCVANSDAYHAPFVTSWNQDPERHTVKLNGQRVALAESDDVDDTRYSVFDMRPYGMRNAGGKGLAPFNPQLDVATLGVDTIRGLTGSNQPTPFTYLTDFIDNGWTGNPGAVFMQVAGAAPKLDFHKQTHKSGGFVSPSVAVTGLSRAQGILGGDPKTFAGGNFDPSDFFKNIDAKLFGVVNLFELIEAAAGDDLFKQAPKFLTQAMESIEKVFAIVQDAQDVGTLIGTHIGKLQAVIANLPANFASVADKDRITQVQAMGLSQEDQGLLLRLWTKAAALGMSAGDMSAAMNALSSVVGTVQAGATAVSDALDQVSSVTEATAGALASQITNALVSVRSALDALVPLLSPGVVPIDDGTRLQILQTATKIASLVDPNALAKLQELVLAFVSAEEAIKNLHVKLEWAPKLKPWPNVQAALFWPNDVHGFHLGVEARGKASGGQPAGAEVYASLVDFELHLLGDDPFLKLIFDKLIFKAGTSGKTEIDCVFRGVHFAGPLSFVETLRNFIPLDGFSDPPNIKVDENGLAANFTLPLPNIAIGVFSLENLSFSAGFEIPFIGKSLTVSFAFCSREEPFALTVCMLGGGGFFAIQLSPAGVHKLEIALEARASLSLDFGVASGSIAVSLGMYFAIEEGDCTLSGYFRLRGEVDVLGGLISASLELYLELTYESSTGKVTGYAMIEISVHVVIFTGTVKVECERKFKGSNGDPTFRQLMAYDPALSYAPWDDYCDAFAA